MSSPNISNSIGPRIIRGKSPKAKFTGNTYKKAKPFLLRDFERRCGYSQQHTDRSLGVRTMEVDHFNPLYDNPRRNDYNNLFLSTRHCNGSKSNTWPTKSARKNGIRFLNPCIEMDYGVHIFEHPITHRLIGISPAGDFHITCCDLNAPHLVIERNDRAQLHDILKNIPITATRSPGLVSLNDMQLLREQVEKMIPLIPYLSKDHPAYDEEIRVYTTLIRGPIST